jgi:hypothetical protein
VNIRTVARPLIIKVDVSDSGTGFSSLVGGGADIGKGRFAVRTQLDYSLFSINDVFYQSGYSNGLRFTTGLVFRF